MWKNVLLWTLTFNVIPRFRPFCSISNRFWDKCKFIFYFFIIIFKKCRNVKKCLEGSNLHTRNTWADAASVEIQEITDDRRSVWNQRHQCLLISLNEFIYFVSSIRILYSNNECLLRKYLIKTKWSFSK